MCTHTDTLHSPKATQIDYSITNLNLDNIIILIKCYESFPLML